MPEVTTLDEATIQQAVALHGDLCPGLAAGIQVAQLAIRELGVHAAENKLIAVVENDTCAVDAIQSMTGCTTGNRNLIRRDWGRLSYTFFRPGDRRAVRISGDPPWDPDYQALRARVLAGEAAPEENAQFRERSEAEADRILDIAPEALFSVEELSDDPPATSRVDPWLLCARCGEAVMETRIRRLDGQELCIPCFEQAVYGRLRSL